MSAWSKSRKSYCSFADQLLVNPYSIPAPTFHPHWTALPVQGVPMQVGTVIPIWVKSSCDHAAPPLTYKRVRSIAYPSRPSKVPKYFGAPRHDSVRPVGICVQIRVSSRSPHEASASTPNTHGPLCQFIPTWPPPRKPFG